MTRNVIFGLAALLTCFAVATTALGDPWKDESGHGKGKGKGHYKHAWKGHKGETPGWARGKGYWDGHFKHGRSLERYRGDFGRYRGGHEYWDRGYRSYGGHPYHHGYSHPSYSPSYRIPYGYHQSAPYSGYSPRPYGQSWGFEGSVRIYPQPGW